jgi:RimJ/RimL family protein N-acetyltransferase
MHRIRLRPTQETDLNFVRLTESAEDNRPFIGQWTRDQHAAALTDPDHRHFILTQTDPPRAVGYLILQGLTDPNRGVQIRRLVVTEKGKGYGRQALKATKKFAFDTCDAHRLWLDVKTYNTRALHLYTSEGFVVEGTLRECVNVGDRFVSLTVMSILRQEYQRSANRGDRPL